MKTNTCKKCLFILPIGLLLALSSGCSNTAANYQPIVDGPRDAKYAQNLQACQQLAQQRSYVNGDVKTGALLGGVIGALTADDDVTPTEGFLAGGLVGGAGRSWETRNERKRIVVSCMKQRGHRVVG